MYRFLLPLLFLVFASAWVNAQHQSISEFDLYGYWVLEESIDPSDNQSHEKRVFVKASESSVKERKYGIVFLAYEKCKFVNSQNWICGPQPNQNDYSWSFDQKLNVINIYSGEQWLKEFRKYALDEFIKFGSPERFEEMTLKVKVQSDGNIKLVNYAQQRL